MTLFPDIADMTVIDLGGTVETWRRAPVRPRLVTVLNLFEPGEPGESDADWLRSVTGDACAAREALAGAGDSTHFDLAFSNSLIEHVGGYAKRSDLARGILDLAPYHWVQTPYRYFPIEPHWLFPGLQFLPLRLRAPIAKNWPLAHSSPASDQDALSEVLWTELIGITEMRSHFPDSKIVYERVLGVVKSISAVLAPA